MASVTEALPARPLAGTDEALLVAQTESGCYLAWDCEETRKKGRHQRYPNLEYPPLPLRYFFCANSLAASAAREKSKIDPAATSPFKLAVELSIAM